MFLIFRHIKKNKNPGQIRLSKKEKQHARAVRISEKENIYLGDGRYRRWPMRLGKDQYTAKLCGPCRSHREVPRIVCMALPKRSRLEKDFLPAAVQLGMSHFQPLLCEYSVHSRFVEQRIRSILQESASQGRRFFLPRLLRAKSIECLHRFLQRLSLAASSILVFHPQAKLTFDSYYQSKPDMGRTGIAILIGPEGGFSDKELNDFQRRSYTLLRLGSGENILRVATAGLAALAKLI